ncbi:hypothetical protein [uncultured Bacteroides sp.]|uniref:hypothetical protein n=1 Tax=uncultured Bacteroides sp. TaxID=162156 RepID=UPI002AA92DA3|nr:hypothetical protein [uncultured Bacteroides sp.]
MNNSKSLYKGITGIFIAIIFTACSTYTIPVDSFMAQMATSSKINKATNKPGIIFARADKLETNGIEYIECLNKKQQPVKVKVNPNILMQVTDSNNKKTVFYFDTVLKEDSVITGFISYIFMTKKSIPLNSIRKIIIDASRKGNFSYK